MADATPLARDCFAASNMYTAMYSNQIVVISWYICLYLPSCRGCWLVMDIGVMKSAKYFAQLQFWSMLVAQAIVFSCVFSILDCDWPDVL